MKKFTRRQFINQTIKGTTGLLAVPMFNNTFTHLLKEPLDKSRVVKVIDENVVSGRSIDQSIVQIMIDSGIRSLAGISDIGEAWKSFFPGITQDSMIGIKINCIARQNNPYGLASHPELIYSIADSLTRMQIDGNPFPEENIIIWDRAEYEMTRSGFTINKGSTGVKCYGTRYDIMNDGRNTTGYSTATQYDVNGIMQYLSKILVEQCDYLINTCLLKDHSFSGITLSLKNHYGSCWDPYHLHFGYCNPYIPALNTLAPIKSKQVLNICDALFGIVSGGPMGSPQVTPKSLILSTDPVALDTIGTQMLKDNGTTNSTILKARHIETAAKSPYNLGTNDPENIELIAIDNPSTGVDENEPDQFYPKEFFIFQNYPNPFNTQTTISYQLLKPARVKLNIYNLKGERVRMLVDTFQNSGFFRIIWDGNMFNDIPAPSGIYLADFQINKTHEVIKMQLIK